MAALTVRNLPDAVHRALKARAASHGRSTEAEIREILAAAVLHPQRTRIGSALAAFAKENGGMDLTTKRDDAPLEAAKFE